MRCTVFVVRRDKDDQGATFKFDACRKRNDHIAGALPDAKFQGFVVQIPF